MAEPPLKRQREEEDPSVVGESEDDPKRQKSYNQILSLLEEEDHQEPNQEFSSIFTTLERELSCDSSSTAFDGAFSDAGPDSDGGRCKGEDEEDEEEREKVMRRLLEASDDELGIPNSDRVAGVDADVAAVADTDEAFSLCDGLLWEWEDEAANYNTMLQSELFL